MPRALQPFDVPVVRFISWTEDCLSDVGDADLVIDGLVGIGGSGALREPMAECVRVVNALANAIVSVDIPSGVNADTGAVEGEAIDADLTVTFGALKPGLLLMPGKAFAGAIHFVDIDLDSTLGEPIALCWRRRMSPTFCTLPRAAITSTRAE
jgi:hydroxyethylthiazole kinase-like uncharacterized protein yjeF